MTDAPSQAPAAQSTQPLRGWDGDGSPFHEGEQAAQRRVGVRDRIEAVGRRVIRGIMPDQHRAFFEQLPFVLVGSVDDAGRPWASILVGEPGFIRSPDPGALGIAASPLAGDPLGRNLRQGASLGLLGIEPTTRRRNRMNATVAAMDRDGFALRVDQSFGNCPKYIQARAHRFVRPPDERADGAEMVREEHLLSDRARRLIRQADTFFIATAAPGVNTGDRVRGADVSHRGGSPGFVDVVERNGATVLRSPDFIGNFHFSTFGNIELDPRAGQLFVDFETGDLLLLTGEARVLWDGPEVDAVAGAERILEFRVSEGVFLSDALPMRFGEATPARELSARDRS